jgi:hypothetical protein
MEPVCAAARPVVKLALTAEAAARRSNFLMSYSFLLNSPFALDPNAKRGFKN